jgi:hypothetical protein
MRAQFHLEEGHSDGMEFSSSQDSGCLCGKDFPGIPHETSAPQRGQPRPEEVRASLCSPSQPETHGDPSSGLPGWDYRLGVLGGPRFLIYMKVSDTPDTMLITHLTQCPENRKL